MHAPSQIMPCRRASLPCKKRAHVSTMEGAGRITAVPVLPPLSQGASSTEVFLMPALSHGRGLRGASFVYVSVFVMTFAAGRDVSSAEPAAPQQKARAQTEFFESHIRPVLIEQCVACHGPQKQESGLRLDSRDAVFKGGAGGAAVVPGRPEESLLIEALRHEGLEMPPEKKLDDAVVADFETWVRSGAFWPAGDRPVAAALGDQVAIFQQAKTHWAFQPVRKPEPPTVRDAAWARTPIDRFVLAKLEAHGLHPSPEADAAVLCRRVYFDLVGLPPSPEEVDAFVRAYTGSSSPNLPVSPAGQDEETRRRGEREKAYEALIDKLLASPHYGERWGRHWLDVARYADTRDFIAAGIDRRYPYAYTYRDWVVKAFNDDLPYDEFIRAQLAADFYASDKQSPSLAALGLLTVGSRFRNNEQEQIADRIDVVTRGFLGFSVACARCHDHKYDPIPTADYYSLYGVFASCQEPAEFPLIAGMIPPPDLLADYEQARQEKVKALDDYAAGLRDTAEADLMEKIDQYLLGYYELSVTKKESIRGLISSRKLKETAMTPLAANLEAARKLPKWRSDPVLGPLFHLLTVIDKNFDGHLRKIVKFGTTGDEKPTEVNAVVLATLRDAQPKTKSDVVAAYGKLLLEASQKWAALRMQSPSADRLPDADWEAIRATIVAEDGPFALEPKACLQASRLLGNGRTTLAKLENEIKEVDITHPGAPARAFAIEDKPKPVNPVIFLRGDSARRGDPVPRRFLEVLAGKERTPFAVGSGRKELAEAIADPKNPLTARVYVNRLWLHHFGAGIVDTPADFGFRSDPPSHPELLDWLAATFVEQGWSTKRMHREILLSSAYRQTSEVPAAAGEKSPAAVDPENRLLWRANRRRLDFEALRDAMLAVSGKLDPAIGGRAVELSAEPFSWRRTIYGFVDRLNLDPVFSTFDFASPEVSTPERAVTLVPQQALFGMNHPFVIEQARALCASPEFAQARDDDARTKVLYRRVFDRAPTQGELDLTRSFLVAAADAERNSGDRRQVWRYGYGAVDASADDADRFHELTFFDGKNYQGSKDYPDPRIGHVRLSAVGGHPGRSQEFATIRRWTAPVDGDMTISGTLAHLRDNGDGIRARIVTGDGRTLGEWKLLNDKAATDVERISVRAGDVIDFIVDCRAKPTADAFTWAPVLRQLDQPKQGAPLVWSANADFAAPPPPLLTAWEQCAQALLLTNEFWFVD
ncbi:MAG: hypothetical protein C0483_03160 [Pirellula sp.]|nr:hypothetical protein [Pirellula sp.]